MGLLLLASSLACGPRGSDGSPVTPGGNGAAPDGPGPQGPNESDESIDDLRARLDRLHAKQAEMATSSDGSFGVCEDLCSLASSICSVKEKLCEVADRHPGEEEYQGLCRKAELECSETEDSCVACVEARERGGSDGVEGQ
ncbi:MAG: hypothetical protein KDK70_31985 [Myxococcales bacterium]|nr:hypothetical protein [Myxococcales bacterium]